MSVSAPTTIEIPPRGKEYVTPSTDRAAPVSNANGLSAVAAESEPLSIAISRESSPVKLVVKPMLN